MTDVDPIALRDLAVAIAREAGTLILDRLTEGRQIEMKSSPTDLVSEMDLRSEALVVSRILEARPDDGILGEEGASRGARLASAGSSTRSTARRTTCTASHISPFPSVSRPTASRSPEPCSALPQTSASPPPVGTVQP